LAGIADHPGHCQELIHDRNATREIDMVAAFDCRAGNRHRVITVKFFCALSVMVRLAMVCVLTGVAVGLFLGVQLASAVGS
jgi:hypothetical protein